MTGRKERVKAVWLPLCAMMLGCLLCGFLPDITESTTRLVAPLLLVVLLLFGMILDYKKALTTDRVIWLLFAAGFILRIFYVLYTPYYVRQHDVWLVTSGKGHMGYIQYIAEHLSLPDTNRIWQFSHPPLHHLPAGLLYRLLSDIGLQAELIAEKLQFLTAFYSCALMVVCDRLFCLCELKKSGRILANTIIVFHPTFFLLGGCLNNDMLCLLLSVTSLTLFAAWWKQENTLALVLCGGALGLAMMAKVSAALLAFPLAAGLAAKAFAGTQKLSRLIKQVALFGVVSVPLGMWFPLRNLFRFGQSLGYVATLSPEANASQYLAGISAARRLFVIPTSQLTSPFQSWSADDPGCNIFLSLFKTSVFGEGQWGGGIVATLLLWVSIVLALLSFAVLIRRSCGILSRKPKNGLYAIWLLFTLITLSSFVIFCFAYPFICSQDFRYLAALLPFGALALGSLHTSSIPRPVCGLLFGGVALFALSSTILYAFPHTL